MKRNATPKFISIIMMSGCFLILIGSASGIFMSPEAMQTAIVQGVLSLLMLVGSYWFGATNKQDHTNDNFNNNPIKTKTMEFAFWDLNPIEGVVTDINGEAIDPLDINDLPTAFNQFRVTKDDTDMYVLLVNDTIAVTLKVNGNIFTPTIPSWFGNVPTRPK